jgi:hypothetical protein
MTVKNGSTNGSAALPDSSMYPALHYARDAERQTLVQVNGSYVGVQERVISREYDPAGTLRYERIEERAWTAPVSSVPADRLVHHSCSALASGEEASLRRVLAGLELAERIAVIGRE